MDANARLTTLTRIGFAARGLLYIVIGVLVIGTGRTEDPAGALRYLGDGGGRLLLIVMAAGLIAYGIWRLCDAILDIERHGSTGKAIAERLGAGFSGVVHLLLAWQAIGLIRGTAKAAGGSQDQAQTALALPGGGPLLIAIGGLVIAVGLFQLVKAVKGHFLRHLEPQVARTAWAKWTGRSGYAARGLVFVISGAFLARAGLDERASEAGGMAETLSWLTNPWDLLVGVGLVGFGLFSLIEARFRLLHDVPVDQMVARATR